MFISKIFLIFFICMFSFCGISISQNENINQSQPKDKPDLSLKMERSGCYGRCPIYDLTIQPDGKVIFDGKGYTEKTGKVEETINDEKIKQLIAEIEKVNFFSLDDAYNNDSNNCPTTVTDDASVKLYIKLNGKEKTIDHYLGCWENKQEEIKSNNSNEVKISNEDVTKRIFPQQLYNLENKIDEIVETKHWIGEQK